MTKVNGASKIVLDKLRELAEQNGGHHKLNNSKTFMPLSIEKLGKAVISICHYGEQNGDLMRDPEMIFWKDEKGEYFPYYLRNDYLGKENIFGEVKGGILEVSNRIGQTTLTKFANDWLARVKDQQGLV